MRISTCLRSDNTRKYRLKGKKESIFSIWNKKYSCNQALKKYSEHGEDTSQRNLWHHTARPLHLNLLRISSLHLQEARLELWTFLKLKNHLKVMIFICRNKDKTEPLTLNKYITMNSTLVQTHLRQKTSHHTLNMSNLTHFLKNLNLQVEKLKKAFLKTKKLKKSCNNRRLKVGDKDKQKTQVKKDKMKNRPSFNKKWGKWKFHKKKERVRCSKS